MTGSDDAKELAMILRDRIILSHYFKHAGFGNFAENYREG